MAKHVTVRIPEADLEALRDALASGEGIVEAAMKVAGAPEHPVTMFEGPTGSKFRVTTGHPVRLLWPVKTDDDISIPVALSWYADPKITEARGSVENALELARRLRVLACAE